MPPPAPAPAQTAGKPAPRELADWVKASSQNAKLMVELMAKIQPEAAASLGVEGYDDQISDMTPGFIGRQLKAIREVREELARRLPGEADARVKQDLEILIKTADDMIKQTELSDRLEVPYVSLAELMFGSFRGLLDDQVAASRHPAAAVRLRKYAGLEPGTKPITEHVIALVRERMADPKLLPPVKSKVEKDLAQATFFVAGIGKLCERFKVPGFGPAYETLKGQLAAWDGFVRSEVLPRSREDFRMPPELYAHALDQIGIDIPPAELASRAHLAFADIQEQMRVVAAEVAKDKGLPWAHYREVIRALKKDQVVGEAILALYKERLGQIEAIIRDKQILTLPNRPARIRLATEAESGDPRTQHASPPVAGQHGRGRRVRAPARRPRQVGEEAEVRRLHVRRRLLDPDGPRGPARPRATVLGDDGTGRLRRPGPLRVQ